MWVMYGPTLEHVFLNNWYNDLFSSFTLRFQFLTSYSFDGKMAESQKQLKERLGTGIPKEVEEEVNQE